MRIAILGQQKFGKVVLEGFLDRGDTVAGVFCAPDTGKAGPPDPLKSSAAEAGIPVFQLKSLRSEAARTTLRTLDVDLAVMAYVLQFAPEDFTTIPRHGTIQFHPSLLPRHRGPSAINWPIILGETATGISIFRPTDGLDEGPVILQRTLRIGPDDTLGAVYFDGLFPLGVSALLEASKQIVEGRATVMPQEESQATYEGWCRTAESSINWHSHVDLIYNLIRGCDPSPGAWTLLHGQKLQLFDARKHGTGRHSSSSVGVGQVSALSERGFLVATHAGQIEIGRVRYNNGDKVSAASFCAGVNLAVGTQLG